MKAEVMELPLFPLNVVLFPGQTLPLHIFEPRYRAMIKRCIEQTQPFGVVLARDDDMEPYTIGTLARITQVEKLPDGRMNILTVGIERFRLQHVYQGHDDYLIGDAVFYPFRKEDPPPDDLVIQVVVGLRKYLTLLSRLSGAKFRFDQFPKDAKALGVFAAIALQVPLSQKQELLSTENVCDLLDREVKLLQSEQRLLSIMASSVRPTEEKDDLIFSRN